MDSKQLIVKGYAAREGDRRVALCLNFSLAAQSDSLQD